MNKSPNWPIARTMVVSRPYRNPRCRSCPNSNSGSRLARSIDRSTTTNAVNATVARTNANGMTEIARDAGQAFQFPTVRSLIGFHHP